MSERSAFSNEDEWNLLRTALWSNQRQERKDNLLAEVQARRSAHDRYTREMALVNLTTVSSPSALALVIHRHSKQLSELRWHNKVNRRLIENRQKAERAELEMWIKQQKIQRNETEIFDQFCKTFDWSLSQQQQAYYQQALRNGFTLVLTDLTKSILWASQQFLTMTGYQPVEVLHQTPRFLQGPGTDQATVAHIRERLSKGQDVEAELLNYRKSGEPYRCRLQIAPLRNSHSTLTHFLAVEYEG